MFDALAHLFAAVCGQNPDHTWSPGGLWLPCCQRCTGLYAGACVAALLHLWLKPKLSNRLLQVHGAFLLLMVPYGFHWLPQGPELRTITGVLFGFGIVTFLRLTPAARWTTASAPARRSRNQSSADFQVCCIAGFQTCGRSDDPRPADLEVGDTAGLETCATTRHCMAGKFAQANKTFTDSSTKPDATTLYSFGVVAMLALLPTFAAQGGRVAAYMLSLLVAGGALVLGTLVVANVGLGLIGAVRLIRQFARSGMAS